MFKTSKIENINILGTDVPVIISTWKCNHQEADGLYECGKIYLREEYEDEDHYRRVFFHECIHALCEILGCQLDHHMEETLAHTVSTMMVKHF